MKRNQYGVNFDLGVPLQTEEEFELLYVELTPEKKQRLIDWINDDNQGPLVAAGQIGTGKSTLIEKAFREASPPDVRIGLDTEVPFYDSGTFWGVLLGKIVEFARYVECNLESFRLPEDLLGIDYEHDGLGELVNALCKRPLSMADFNKKRALYRAIDENIEVVKRQLLDIFELTADKIDRKPLIFAEGIDKFSPDSADYVSMLDVLNFLSRYKTLYEANLIHLLGSGEKWHNGKKVLLTGTSNEIMSEILEKRLGVYAQAKEGMLPLLASLSGGNVRQAIRLLIEYDFALGKKEKDTKGALDEACRRTRDDLLNVLSGTMDPELLKVVHRDGYITSGTLKDLVTRDASQSAVYLNWIFITGDADDELKWPAHVNPLLLPAVEAFKSIPESPEIRMLREWANEHEISPFGLDIDIAALDKNKFFDIIGSQTALAPLNIIEIFDSLAAYFLNPERRDKVIIAYENAKLARPVNDLLIGKAGVYRPANFKDINFAEVPDHRLDIYLNRLENEQNEGYSVFFDKQLTEEEAIALEQRRDVFIDYKMIWWIPFNDLKGYLKYWPQSRQFFKIFRLEEDILSTITKEEIAEDLEDLDHVESSTDTKEQLKERLQRVLDYLKMIKNG